jgi:hypothetical protein
MSDDKRYDYFEKEGAVFRRRLPPPGLRVAPLVHDIKVNGKWEPYQGDRHAPVYFGDEISAKEAGETEERDGR